MAMAAKTPPAPFGTIGTQIFICIGCIIDWKLVSDAHIYLAHANLQFVRNHDIIIQSSNYKGNDDFKSKFNFLALTAPAGENHPGGEMGSRKHYWGNVAAWLATAICIGPSPSQAADPYKIQSMRWEEDYRYLKDRTKKPEGWEQLKFVPLTDDRHIWLSLGAELRTRLDMVENGGFGLKPDSDYMTATQRVSAHMDLQVEDAARLFVQIAYHDENGRRPRERSFDEGGIDLQQAFADWTISSAARLRIGRQELPLGNQRLSEVREGGNIRRSFDAIRADIALSGANITAFYGQPVQNFSDNFDDAAIKGEHFFGTYVSFPEIEKWQPEAYVLVREKHAAVFQEATADETRVTYGARIHKSEGAWDADMSANWQSGSAGTRDIAAFALTADMGWTAHAWAWSPRLGLRADFTSGDRTIGDGQLNSFDAPYPNFSYLSSTSAYLPGNAWSIFPLVTAKPNEQTTVYFGAQTMFRVSLNDAFYYQPQSPTVLNNDLHNVMNQAYARLKWQPDLHWSLSATGIYQAAGTATHQAGGQNVGIGSVSMSFKF